MSNNDLARECRWLFDEKYGGEDCEAYQLDKRRLLAGEPVDYVIGFSRFLGEKVDLSYRTLIPRTETEYWVKIAIEELQKEYGKEMPLCFLDVFSGSGCIGIAVARAFPNATVYFSDIDENAIKQINKNIDIAGLDTKRCKIYKSDIFTALPQDIKFTAIFANPPYIASETTVATAVLEHEPHNALFAKDDGLFFIKETLRVAKDFLADNGSIYLEHDRGQEEAIAHYARSLNWQNVLANKDQYGYQRWVRVNN